MVHDLEMVEAAVVEDGARRASLPHGVNGVNGADDETNTTALLLNDVRRKSGSPVRVQIVPSQPKTLSHLPTRPAVDLAFQDLTYSVREGRRSSKYTLCFLAIIVFVGKLDYISRERAR